MCHGHVLDDDHSSDHLALPPLLEEVDGCSCLAQPEEHQSSCHHSTPKEQRFFFWPLALQQLLQTRHDELHPVTSPFSKAWIQLKSKALHWREQFEDQLHSTQSCLALLEVLVHAKDSLLLPQEQLAVSVRLLLPHQSG